MQNKTYTIRTIANKLKISTSLIRFWCDEFDIEPIVQNKKGDVKFDEKDYQKILDIHKLIEKEKKTLEKTKELLNQQKKEEKENKKTVEKLEEIKGFLKFLRNKLD